MTGKRIGNSIYVHISILSHLSSSKRNCIKEAERIAAPMPFAPNVFRVDEKKKQVSLLFYSDFEVDPFPCLMGSIFVDLSQSRARSRSYLLSKNPPILHRKELLLGQGHPSFVKLAALTTELVNLGMYDNSHLIGHSNAWQARLNNAGIFVDKCGSLKFRSNRSE